MNEEIDWSKDGTVTIKDPATITMNTGLTFTSSASYSDNYDWPLLLEECPYEYLKKEFRKRNLKKLLEDNP